MMAGTSQAQFIELGNVQRLGDNCYQLTDTVNANSNNDTSAIWFPTQIDLSQGFDISFQVSIMSNAGGPFFAADGLAFVLQTAGTNALGPAGNSMGYAHLYDGVTCGAPYNFGIDPSMAVELDLFHNGVCIADPAGGGDHIAIVDNGRYDVAFPATPPNPFFPTAGDVAYDPAATPTCYAMRVHYHGDTTDVYFNGILRVRRTNFDIAANIFGGNNMVYWGITAATGSQGARMTVCYENTDAGTDTAMCANDELALNGIGGGTFSWSPGTGLSSPSAQNPTFDPPAPGTYQFELATTTAYGCSDIDSITITVDSVPTAFTGPDMGICPGQSVTLGGPAASGNFSYTWSPATGLNDPTLPDPTASPTSATSYQLIVQDTTTATMCADTATVNLTLTGTLAVDAGPDDTLCLGDTLQIGLIAQPGLAYAWTPTTTLINPTAAQTGAFPSTTTQYNLFVSDTANGGGCTGTDSVLITVVDVNAIAGGETDICLGQSAVLYAEGSGGFGGYTYSWNPAPDSTTTIGDTAWVAPTAPTTYTVTATEGSRGCTGTDNWFLNVIELQVDLVTDRDTANPGQPVYLNASGAHIYVWSDTIPGLTCYDCPNPIAIANPGATSWEVLGIDTVQGCQGTAQAQVVLIDYQIPNVFSPNNDGVNDVLKFDYWGQDVNLESVQIYDRWGHLVYNTNNPRIMWDGRTSSGQNCPEGVYYIAIKIVGDRTIPESQKNIGASVTLLR